MRREPSAERAWQDLLGKAGDGYVTNVQLKESWTYGFIGTWYRSTFRATVYPRSAGTAELGAPAPPDGLRP